MKKALFVLTLLTAGSMVACQTSREEIADSNERGKFQSVVVNFDKGSARIPAGDLAKLQTTARSLKNTDHLDDITAAVWSDYNYPADQDRELPQAQRDLTQARIDAIQEALRPYDSVSAFNMSRKASWFSRAVNADGAELDSLFTKRDPTAMDRNDFYLIKENGGPSKAVVVFERD